MVIVTFEVMHGIIANDTYTPVCVIRGGFCRGLCQGGLCFARII